MTRPDRALLQDAVAQKVLTALEVSSAALTRAGVRHIVVGGLAVGALGHPRATRVVDFLVGNEAFVHHEDGLVTMRPEVPFQVNGIAIDLLAPGPDEAFLETALDGAPGSFAEASVLVYLKLKSPRLKDRVDIIELIKAGIDVEECRAYLQEHAAALSMSFDEVVACARAEEK